MISSVYGPNLHLFPPRFVLEIGRTPVLSNRTVSLISFNNLRPLRSRSLLDRNSLSKARGSSALEWGKFI